MPEDNRAGGSEEGQSDSADESKKTTKEIAVDQIIAERDALKEQVTNLQKRLKDVTKERNELDKLRHDELKGSMGNELIKLTNYDAEDIDAMTLQQIAEKLETARHVKGPSYKSIRFGAAAKEEENPRWTVGDLTLNQPWRKIREG